MSDEARANLLRLQEQARDAVAALTGIKQQFVEAGWTNRGAEQMTHAMLLSSMGGKS